MQRTKNGCLIHVPPDRRRAVIDLCNLLPRVSAFRGNVAGAVHLCGFPEEVRLIGLRVEQLFRPDAVEEPKPFCPADDAGSQQSEVGSGG